MLNDIQMLQALSGRGDATVMNRSQRNKLRKDLTAASGFVGLELKDYAKLMLPVYAGLTHRIPTTTPENGATSAQWRTLLGYNGFDWGANMGTSEAANGAGQSLSATSFSAPYYEQSIEGDVTKTAINQARGFDDAMAIDTSYRLSQLMRLQEYITLFGNRAAITMSTPTATASTTHAGPTFANGTWHFRVTALTGQGTLTNAKGNAFPTDNSNTGESTVATIAIASGGSGCDFFDVVVPRVPNALGYKVYAEASAGGGTYYLLNPATDLAYAAADTNGAYNTTAGAAIVPPVTGQTFVTVTRFQIKAVGVNTNPTPPVADGTANSLVTEGLSAWATKSTIYSVALPFRNVIDQAGLGLTSTAMGCKEWDSILATQWTTNHNAPSLVLCSANSIDHFARTLAKGGTSNQIRLDVYQDRNQITGGLYYSGYISRYASAQAGVSATITVWAHPYMPDGTYLFISENVPTTTVPYSRTGKIFERDVQQPYEYFPLGPTRRSFPYDTWYEETIICAWPDVQAAITGVNVSL